MLIVSILPPCANSWPVDHLLFSDEQITTLGGICYDGVMVPLATMLCQYWQMGRIDRYDISGPDMIHYASQNGFQGDMSRMLAHLRKWNPKLVPPTIVTRMFPGTVARIGHIRNHVSEEVMTRKVQALRSPPAGEWKKRLWEVAKEDEASWPIQVKPAQDHYFSQHDLLALGKELLVDEYWREIPLENMRETLARANSLLRLR